MIIGFIGSNFSRNKRVEALCSIATASSIAYKQKSLILSLCNHDGMEVVPEDMLVGKKMNALNVMSLANAFSDTGIDALLSRAESERLTQETFDTCCLQTLKGTYTLDIAKATSKTSLEEELISRIPDIQNLLDAAEKIYDIVYVLLPHNNTQLSKKLYPLMNKIVVCVGQRSKEDILEPYKKSGYVLITDYDNVSQYTTRYLNKQYPYPVYAMKHNPLFKDACTNLDMLNFILQNEKVETYDDNYDFITSIMTLADKLVSEVEPVKQKEADLARIPLRIEERDNLKTINKEAVETKNIKSSKGFLFFRKKRDVVTINPSNDNSYEDEPAKKNLADMDNTEAEKELDETEEEILDEITPKKTVAKKTTAVQKNAKAPVKKTAVKAAASNKTTATKTAKDTKETVKEANAKASSPEAKTTTTKGTVTRKKAPATSKAKVVETKENTDKNIVAEVKEPVKKSSSKSNTTKTVAKATAAKKTPAKKAEKTSETEKSSSVTKKTPARTKKVTTETGASKKVSVTKKTS